MASKIAPPFIPPLNFKDFAFEPRSIKESETPSAVAYMFEDLGLIKRWKISPETLLKFIDSVKNGYLFMPYHNWSLGFSVAHFCYLLNKNVNLRGTYFSEIEFLALFVGCLGIDLGHVGTDNSFQWAAKRDIGKFKESPLENHHFLELENILNTPGSKILENLSEGDYEECLCCIKKVILSSDPDHHVQIITDIEKMIGEGYDFTRAEHRQLLLSLIVNVCNLSDQVKSWETSKNTASMIYKEYFCQWDMEYALSLPGTPSMDRNGDIPDGRVKFLQNIVHPFFRLLGALFPKVTQTDNIETIINYWQSMGNYYRHELTKDIVEQAIRSGVFKNAKEFIYFRKEHPLDSAALVYEGIIDGKVKL